MPGEIISERRATSNRNGGRHHRGFVGDFPRNPQGESPEQDPNAVNEDFDDASSDNIRRIERKADALINGMAGKLQTVIDELKKPKWNSATT
jgi:hypothetical protein